MPELPEVETVARRLAPHVEGRAVRSLKILDDRLRTAPVPRVAGRRIVGVERSGKRVLVGFSPRTRGGGGLWLAVHLRMTGRLLWREPDETEARPRHRARFLFDRGEMLFADTRRFGTFDWYGRREEAEPAGIDPLSPRLTARRFAELLDDSSQPLKAWLLRQDRLVGLGNIYASEILHRARLSPFRAAGTLDRGERARLHRATRTILARAIDACGTTFSDFQDARGVEGSYQRFLAVYDREGEACRRCKAPIARSVQQQRSTFHCPRCQG